MKPYRYPQKLRPDVDFTTWRRNLSYITTQIFLRRHVISRASGEKTIPCGIAAARDSHHLFTLYRKLALKNAPTLRIYIPQNYLPSS